MAEVPLHGRTALITGAGQRLGREIALALASEGVHIIVHFHRSDSNAEDLARKIRDRGVKAWTVGADFQIPGEYGSLIRKSLEMAGNIDILINNAAIFPPGTLEGLEFRELVRNLEINTWVPLVLCRALKESIERGKIINILDTRIKGFDSRHAGYTLSKYLLSRLTSWTALEFAPAFTVNAVAPGLILPPPGKDESDLKKMQHRVPLRAHGDAGDISSAVVFLLKSTFITGQTIFVDGGRHLLESVES